MHFPHNLNKFKVVILFVSWTKLLKFRAKRSGDKMRQQRYYDHITAASRYVREDFPGGSFSIPKEKFLEGGRAAFLQMWSGVSHFVK